MLGRIGICVCIYVFSYIYINKYGYINKSSFEWLIFLDDLQGSMGVRLFFK